MFIICCKNDLCICSSFVHKGTFSSQVTCLTFYRETGSVVIFSFGVDCLTLIGATVFVLDIEQVKMSPCRAYLVILWELSI